jgi:hypothetical protein
MAVKRTGADADELVELLAGSDRPIRLVLRTGSGEVVGDPVDTTLGALRYPSARISFPAPAASRVLSVGLSEDELQDDD